MPVHDWTLVESGVFHALHTTWIAEIQNALNEGNLPTEYYALAEQHAGQYIADVLTLHETPDSQEPLPPLPPDTGGVAVAEAPPQVQRRLTIETEDLADRQRSIAIRHVTGHRLVAILEIAWPANKDCREHVEAFACKAVDALKQGIHLIIIDLFPPGPHDPRGMHDEIVRRISPHHDPYDLPAEQPLTLASYAAQGSIEAYLQHLAVDAELPAMPLFLRPDRYVEAPLAATYQAAYAGMPKFWRDVLESAKGA